MKLHIAILRVSLSLLILFVAVSGFPTAAQTKKDSTPVKKARSSSQTETKKLQSEEDRKELVPEGPEFLRRRQEWFFQPRAFPLGFIPQGSRERALERMKQMYIEEGRFNLLSATNGAGFVAPASGTNSAWTAIGPQATSTAFFGGTTSGRVTALAVNPNNPNNVYLGGADGGLWITTDGGTTWTSLTDFPPNTGIPTIAVGALALDPATCTATICATVYVGTGEDNFAADNIYGEGVLTCTVAAGPPPSASCTQDNTFHLTGTGVPLDNRRGGPLVGALAVNRMAGKQNILLAGVRGLKSTAIPSGIWCSTDSGATWTRVLPTGATSVSAVGTDVAFASDGTGWAAIGSPGGDATNNGIYKTSAPITSCGTTSWTKQTLPAALSTNIARVSLAIAPSDDNIVYTMISDSSTGSNRLLGVGHTVNGTSATPTWTQVTGGSDMHLVGASGICNSQCFYDLTIAVSPASPLTVFLGGAAGNGTLIRSVDGGMTTFTEISRSRFSDGIHVDMHAIAFSKDGSIMYVGHDGGVSKTTTPTGTPSAGFWTNLNADLDITQFYPGLSISPVNASFALAGSQDNDIQQFQGAGQPWISQDIGCDGGYTAIDPSSPSTIYGECEYLPSPGGILIIRKATGGQKLGNGIGVTSGIDGTDRGSFIPPLILDQNNPQTLYFATCRVWQTTDGGANWTAISPDLTTSAHTAGCAANSNSGAFLSTIAVGSSDGKTIYTGAINSEVEVTSDGGTNWASITTAALPMRSVTELAVDPTNKNTAFVAFSGFGTCNNAAIICDGKGHVFKTVNGTAGAATTWIDVSGTLPDIPVNAIVLDPNDLTRNTLYIGTDVGTFFTTTGGATWSPLGAAGTLPNVQVTGMVLHEPSRTLRVVTHGRGAWDLSLAGQALPTITSISPMMANAGGAAFPLTVSGTGFVNGAQVNFGAATPVTTFGSTAQVTAAITAAEIATAGPVSVTVTNPAGGGTSNSVNFTVNAPAPSFTVSGGAVTVTAGGMNNSAITVSSTGGFTGMVTVTCPTAANLPPGVTCTAPTALTVPANGSVMGNMTFAVAAPSAANATASVTADRRVYAAGITPTGNSRGWWMLSAGTGFGAIILLLLPGRRRVRAALGLGLVCVLSFALGCGGGGGGGVVTPVMTATHETVTSPTKGASGTTFTFSAAVTGGTPTGQAQLFDNGTATGSSVAVTNGTATLTTAGLTVVGTHPISAHYLGSTTTQVSQSGTLNVTVTGTTSLTITGTSGATTANGNVSLTIN